LEQKPLWQLVEQHWLPLEHDWPSTLQLPPGRLAQTPASHVPVQQSFPEEQVWLTSLQTLFEQVPLTQLLRQQSVSVLHDPPFAWQKLGVAHTVPSQTPLQQGTPDAHAVPVTRQAGLMPPSGPPSFPPPTLAGGLTDPLQLHAPNVRTAPRDQRSRNARDVCIEDVLRERRAGRARRDGRSMIAPIARSVEEVEVGSLRMQSANRRA